MSHRDVLRRTLVALTLSAVCVGSMGCDDDELSCGEGTITEDGMCVVDPVILDQPVPQPNCGEGTVLDATGVCVSTSRTSTCGPGTVLENMSCVPISNAQCGPGTTTSTLREGTEVIDLCVGDVECGENTVVNTSGVCVPDFLVVCGSGTLEHDGVCLDLIAALDALGALVGIEEDDPDLGTPLPFSLAGPGLSVVLQGTIDVPSDRDGNGAVDQDVDWFAFEATAGEVIEIQGFSDGLPAPHIAVVGAETDNAFFWRETAVHRDNQPLRQLVIPVTGRYFVRVSDAFGSPESPVGSPDYGYFVGVTAHGPLDLNALEIAAIGTPFSAGYDDIAAGARILDAPVSGLDEHLVAHVEHVSEAHAPALLVFSTGFGLLAEIRDFDALDDVGLTNLATGTIVVPDFISASGYGTDETTRLRLGPMATASLPGATSITAPGGGSSLRSFGEVDADRMVRVVAQLDSRSFAVELVDESGALLIRRVGTDRVELHWYNASLGTVLLRMRDLDGVDATYSISASTSPVDRLAELDSSGMDEAMTMFTALSVGTERWLAFPVPQTLGTFEVTATPASPSASIELDLYRQLGVFEHLGNWSTTGTQTAVSALADAEVILAHYQVNSASDVQVDVSGRWTGPTTIAAATADRCDDALTSAAVLSGPGSVGLTIPLAGYSNRVSSLLSNTCHGADAEVDGGDAFFAITLRDGETLDAHVHGRGLGANPAVEILELGPSGCADLTDAVCLAANQDLDLANANLGASASYSNSSGADMNVVVIADAQWPGPYGPNDISSLTLTIQ